MFGYEFSLAATGWLLFGAIVGYLGAMYIDKVRERKPIRTFLISNQKWIADRLLPVEVKVVYEIDSAYFVRFKDTGTTMWVGKKDPTRWIEKTHVQETVPGAAIANEAQKALSAILDLERQKESEETVQDKQIGDTDVS